MSYDPLQADLPRSFQDYIDTYWKATAGEPPADDGPIVEDVDTDVAIIGGGYTGLSCAYSLAGQYGTKVLVLEAHRPGWGCSGRNGSFIRPAIGRLSWQACVDRYGVDIARGLFAQAHRALATMRELIRVGQIDCQQQPDGWLKVAHHPTRVEALQREQRLLRDTFGYEVEFMDAPALKERSFISDEGFGALRFPEAFSAHPLRVALGLVRMARNAGARVHSQSPVIEWRRDGAIHRLRTPSGTVCARHVVIATNGYSTEKLHPSLESRLIPVLSNIIVTRPLSEQERRDSGFISTDIMTDTRKVLNYYRLLPDGRVLLGSRGAIKESPQGNEKIRQVLLTTLKTKFPAFSDVTVDYHWGGWVALSLDSMPRIHSPEDDNSISYAIGYNGSGTSAAVYAGRVLADRLGGGRPVFSVFDTPLPKVPLAGFRRLGQRAAFVLYRYQDAR